MRRLCVLPLLFALSCGAPKLGQVDGDVTLSPETLELGDVWLGYPATATATLQNHSRAKQAVTLTVDAPARLQASEVAVSGSDTHAVVLTFEPAVEGAFTGTLHAEVDGHALSLTFTGHARIAPACAPTDDCHVTGFDPVAGRCVVDAKPEGTACAAGGCIESGHCESGSCVGAPKSCDDDNKCTVDACDPLSGCVHLDNAESCAQPDPVTCTVGFCDPDEGCTTGPASDGTVCGSVDCVTAHVCIFGSCQARSVPDGTACGPTSPCQPSGACHSGVCEQGAKTPLAPLWSYAPGLKITGPAMDSAEQLTFTECGVNCSLVSLTRDGYLRYKVPLVTLGETVTSVLLTQGRTVVMFDDGQVEVRDGASGALVFQKSLLAEVKAELLPSHWPGVPLIDAAWTNGVAADGQGRLFVAFGVTSAQQAGDALQDRGRFLVALDDASGAVVWKLRARSVMGLVLDETGAAFAFVEQDVAGGVSQFLISWTRDGVERFRAEGPGGIPMAAFNGRVILSGAGSAQTADGQALPFPPFFWLEWSASVLLHGNTMWARTSDTLTDNADNTIPEHQLAQVNLVTGVESWRKEVEPDPKQSWTPFAPPVLTSTGRVLVASTSTTARTLREFSGAGTESFSCELSGTEDPQEVQLGQGRLFVLGKTECAYCVKDDPNWRISAYSMPGRALPATGWVTTGGRPERTNRPR